MPGARVTQRTWFEKRQNDANANPEGDDADHAAGADPSTSLGMTTGVIPSERSESRDLHSTVRFLT
jgi:hypothetical protein